MPWTHVWRRWGAAWLRSARAAAAMAALALAIAALGAPRADAHPSPQLAVSQVYGGGGNSGAQYLNDFIEVFNRRGATADLSGYSVQYAAATSGTWSVTPLSGSLRVGGYHLVKEASGGGNGKALPSPDSTGTINLSATSGKVALVSSFTPLTGGCPSGPEVVDMVGFGSSANCSEGGKPTANLSNTLAAVRASGGCADTNFNGSDFQALAPAPRNAGTAAAPCEPVPEAPTLSATDPPSPGNATSIRVFGIAPARSTVEVYSTPDCSGSPLARGDAATLESDGLEVSVASNSTTTLRSLAFDSDNTSDCSDRSIDYVQDSDPPATPILSATDPGSPANGAEPRVLGSAEDGATVRIFATPDCSDGAVGSGTAAELGSGGVVAKVPANSTTSLYATATDAAGNTSRCSAEISYTEDSTAPDAPALGATTPSSPAADPNPRLSGVAEPGSSVSVFASPDCSGGPIATGSAAELDSPGIQLSVKANASTELSATATDAAGNASGCSVPVAYTEDSTVPDAPGLTGTDPASPGPTTKPRLLGSAEDGAEVAVFAGPDCSGAPIAAGLAAELASSGIQVTVAADASTELSATATDTAGNASSCSSAISYEADVTAPDRPSLTAPPSPASGTSPVLMGSSGDGTSVHVHASPDCTGPEVAAVGADELSSAGVAVPAAANARTDYSATATDPVGNESACSDPASYIEDSKAPDAPALYFTDPAPPANDPVPRVHGSAEDGAAVSVYASFDCSGLPLAAGSAADLAASGIKVPVPTDSATELRAVATDAAGNHSACSVALPYVEDSTAPREPDLLATTPASPAAGTKLSVIGSAEDGSFVRVYQSPDCSGPPAGAGSAGQLASEGIGVSVAPGSVTTFRATSTDSAGNTSGCSNSSITYSERSSKGRREPPRVRVLWPRAHRMETPAGKRKVVFSFVADAPATFRCRMDGRGFRPCESPQGYSVRRGKHRFIAEATALDGGPPGVASLDFRVLGP